MATRKAVHDQNAFVAASELMAHRLSEVVADDAPGDLVTMALQDYPIAEYETVTTKVAGEELTMRRVVLTGEWAVVRD